MRIYAKFAQHGSSADLYAGEGNGEGGDSVEGGVGEPTETFGTPQDSPIEHLFMRSSSAGPLALWAVIFSWSPPDGTRKVQSKIEETTMFNMN